MNQQAQAGAKQYLAALTQQLRGLLRQARFAGALHGALQVASIIALAVWVSLSVEHAEIQWVWLPVIVILLGLRWLAANWALLRPLQVATTAARAKGSNTEGPVICSPSPRLTNTPAPMIDPRPIKMAPGKPTTRWNCGEEEFTFVEERASPSS